MYKYVLTKDNLLLIPPNWYYIEEINDYYTMSIDCDNYLLLFIIMK